MEWKSTRAIGLDFMATLLFLALQLAFSSIPKNGQQQQRDFQMQKHYCTKCYYYSILEELKGEEVAIEKSRRLSFFVATGKATEKGSTPLK